MLLVWSVSGLFFSAWTMRDCRFMFVAEAGQEPSAMESFFPVYSEGDDELYQRSFQRNGYMGLLAYEEMVTEYYSGVPYNSYELCIPLDSEAMAGLDDIRNQVSRLMGMVGLAAGGLATLVLLSTFIFEMCCASAGLQYGLGIMYAAATATQGLTFLGVMGNSCSDMGCTVSETATWSILAACLYFIAMVHSFVVPFPQESLCCRDKGIGKGDTDDERIAAEVDEAIMIPVEETSDEDNRINEEQNTSDLEIGSSTSEEIYQEERKAEIEAQFSSLENALEEAIPTMEEICSPPKVKEAVKGENAIPGIDKLFSSPQAEEGVSIIPAIDEICSSSQAEEGDNSVPPINVVDKVDTTE